MKLPKFLKEKDLKTEEITYTDSVTLQVTHNNEITQVYSSDLPDLTTTSGNIKNTLKISISSSQDDDEALIHKLLNKTRTLNTNK